MTGVTTITMPRADARAAFIQYRRAFREAANSEQAKQDRALMQGYRAIAKGQTVIDLNQAMRGARLNEEGYPKLAICRADATHCTVSMDRTAATFYFGERTFGRSVKRQVAIPADTFEPWHGPYRSVRVALVPMIPPQFRPPYKLEGYQLLWEAEWRKATPVDPMLLKHLGGALYAVLAQWDLTPLERAVLAGRL